MTNDETLVKKTFGSPWKNSDEKEIEKKKKNKNGNCKGFGVACKRSNVHIVENPSPPLPKIESLGWVRNFLLERGDTPEKGMLMRK